jgi:ABC-type multidrug transport system fused ATPase/permease subunit
MTVIVIAHRLTSTRDADRVVVMESGRIVEIGRRQDLLVGDGVFSRLIATEAAGTAV